VIGPRSEARCRPSAWWPACAWPVFEGGATGARVTQADAAWKQQAAELDDLKVRIGYEVRAALLDLKAVDQELKTAQSRVSSPTSSFTQATDRFKAGVASNLEVVDAQEAVATATDSRISTLYAFTPPTPRSPARSGVAEGQTLRLVGEQ